MVADLVLMLFLPLVVRPGICNARTANLPAALSPHESFNPFSLNIL